MPKRFKWWSVAQSAFGGAIVAYIAHVGGPWEVAFAVVINAAVWAVGELLNQSSAELCRRATELVEKEAGDAASE